MRRALYGLLLLALAVFAVWRAALAFVSDETRIRWRLQEMAEAFDESRLRPVAAGLAPDFRDRTTDYERALILDLLRAFYLEHARGPFPYAVDLPEDLIAIEVEPDASAATATLVADFTVRKGDTWEPAWSVQIEADLRPTDSGWRLVSTRHETLSGDLRRLQ